MITVNKSAMDIIFLGQIKMNSIDEKLARLDASIYRMNAELYFLTQLLKHNSPPPKWIIAEIALVDKLIRETTDKKLQIVKTMRTN